jgi:hypothetical protein
MVERGLANPIFAGYGTDRFALIGFFEQGKYL